jgi:hypothetical protein
MLRLLAYLRSMERQRVAELVRVGQKIPRQWSLWMLMRQGWV